MTYSVSPDPKLDKRTYTGVLPDALLVELPIPCVRCGYTLSGLKTNSKCPECALPIANSVFADRLEYADERYLKSLVIGARIAQIAPLAMLTMFVCVWVTTPLVAMAVGGMPPTWMIVLFQASIAAVPPLCLFTWIAGWWLLTPPTHAASPASRENTSRLWVRRLSVVEGVAMFLLSGLFLVINIGSIPPSVYIPMVGISAPVLVVSLLAHLFSCERYLASLAHRATIKDFAYRLSSHRLAWLLLLVPITLGILGTIAGSGGIFQFFVFLLAVPIAIWLMIAHVLMLGPIRTAARHALAGD